jgi:hypothetical protein
MSIHKIVVKGTGKISLHERFTQLRFDQKATSVKAATTISSSSYVNDYSAPSFSPPRSRLVPHYPAPRAASPTMRYERYSAAAAVRRPVSSYAVKAEVADSWGASSYARMARPAARAAGVGRSQAGSLSIAGRIPSQSATMIAAAKVWSSLTVSPFFIFKI